MKLDKLTLVNWGQLPPGDYEFGNMTLLTGPTGAGKSTMLDGLQTVMTASYQGIVSYNPGQDEVQAGQRKGKSKRTLESFICGAEYSRFSRPDGAHGYIAAVFRPGPNEEGAKPFTALVAASARVDGSGERRAAKLERLELVIVDEEALCLQDFLVSDEAQEWVAVDDIVKRLKAKYRKVTSYSGHKRDYLCALYGRFRGRVSVNWDETQNAAKAWCQSIAYKAIGSVHDLVRDEILEFDGKQLQESIGRISDLMQQVTNLREEGARIAATVERLRELKAAVADTTSEFEEQVQYDLLAAKAHLQDDEARIAAEKEKVADDRALVTRSLAGRKSEQSLYDSVDRSRIELKAKLSGIAAHGMKERLEESLARATATASKTLEGLQTSLLAAARLENTAKSILGKAIPSECSQLKTAVAALAQSLSSTELGRLSDLRAAVQDAQADTPLVPSKLLSLSRGFEGAHEGLAELHSALVGPSASVSTAIAAESATLDSRIVSTRASVTELAARKARLAGGGANYPRDVAVARDRIRDMFPEAGVQVLCDLVEPKSEQWQPAIEGYLAGARFNLIVKPEWEARTIDYLQSVNSRAKVIQGKHCLARADANRVSRDSIIHELHTDHPIAKAYLIDQFGSVVKVATTEQLRTTDRGLMLTGQGSGARTMFTGETRELVFGKAARAKALQSAEAELAATEVVLSSLLELQKQLEGIRGTLGALREPSFDAQPLEGAANELDHATRALAQLDLTEVQELEAQLLALEAQLRDHRFNIDAHNRTITQAETRVVESQKNIQALDARRADRVLAQDVQLRRLVQLCEVNPKRTFSVMVSEVDALLASNTLSLSAIDSRRERLKSAPANRLGDVRELLAEYNIKAKPEERFRTVLPHLHEAHSFDPCYGPLVELERAVSELHGNMEAVGLYSNRAELEKAESSFHDVFTKQFCVEIKTKVDDGVRTLRQLNTELRNLKFGTDQFRIDWSKWEPEFEEYYDFFKAVAEMADSPETVDLFGQAELSPKHVAVRDRLAALLLDKDQERAGRELLRIADYRNYRRYEIWNESESGGRIALSTWGTGSGGQLETPAYIVRAAVVTNRMRLFDKGASLRLLVNDESFSKMDETRARAVLRYLRDTLGLQLISAMPTRNAGALRPEFDREYSYSRLTVDGNGELDFYLEPDERIFRKDKMRELWEAQRLHARDQAKLEFDRAEPAEASPSTTEVLA